MQKRRKFSREFKLEAVRLVKERGVSVARTARPDHGQMKHEQSAPTSVRFGTM